MEKIYPLRFYSTRIIYAILFMLATSSTCISQKKDSLFQCYLNFKDAYENDGNFEINEVKHFWETTYSINVNDKATGKIREVYLRHKTRVIYTSVTMSLVRCHRKDCCAVLRFVGTDIV